MAPKVSEEKIAVGVDTGGTFTDVVARIGKRIVTYKVPSLPADPSRPVAEALDKVLPGPGRYRMILGSTVATNALLERKGARTALLTGRGFEDLIEIGRQTRQHIYSIYATRPECLVPRRLRFGVNERTGSSGESLVEIVPEELKALAVKLRNSSVESVAICFLHSYRNGEAERKAASILKAAGWFHVSISCEVLPEYREFERFSTTVANAYVSPIVGGYLDSLARRCPGSRISVMLSNGGITAAESAAGKGVETVLSGPAAGVLGALKIARQAGFSKIITLDMGGTSTDVSLCRNGLSLTSESSIGGIPLRVPMVDIRSIGAGGGSIARADEGGALRVGPESAGAKPGPACYGESSLPTVTDADLLAGRIVPESFLGGRMKLDVGRARRAMRTLGARLGMKEERAAEGVISVVEESMASALRVVSVSRGEDPREYSLLCFGGAGGMHAFQLARSLGMRRVVIPPLPGLLSAWGMLVSDWTAHKAKSILRNSAGPRELEREFDKLERGIRKELGRVRGSGGEVKFSRSLEVRYRGQAYEIQIPFSPDYLEVFHRTHHRLYGYSDAKRQVEVVLIRLRGSVAGAEVGLKKLPRGGRSPAAAFWKKQRFFFENGWSSLDVYVRERLRAGNRLRGPALVCEDTSTCFLPPGARAEVDGTGNIIMEACP